ncbi:MAG: hypothetical protein IKW41_05580, partial [Phascolarctobacterium sp.]|nr:hypothetical protein [Phascolarctobacterium sp.]
MAKKITEIEAELQEWEFLKQLPKELEGFTLREGTGIKGNILNIASYVDEANHACVDLIYTGETFDYVIVKNLGLHTFRDDRFFTRDKDKFAEVVLNKLPALLQEMGKSKVKHMGYESEVMGFNEWEDWKTLPKQIGNFELYITPDNPLEYINGSWVILDYSDFVNGNQLMFLYNSFRNELFAEMTKGNLPLTTEEFNANSLEALSALIREKLEKTLTAL